MQRCQFSDFNLKLDFVYPDPGTFIDFQSVFDHFTQINTPFEILFFFDRTVWYFCKWYVKQQG